MGLPRITYNGVDIDFLTDLDELDVQYPDLNTKNTAVSGMAETLVARNDVMVRAGQSMEIDEDLKRKLRNWFEWAKKGLQWTFARDRDETVLVQLAADGDAGDTTIELTDADDVVVGKQYVIRTDTLLQVVKIESVSAPNVTLAEPLIFDFPTGSRFRSELFWPGRLLSNTNPIVSGRVLYGILLDFKEDLNLFTLDLPTTIIARPTIHEEYIPDPPYDELSNISDGDLGNDDDAAIGHSTTYAEYVLLGTSGGANYAVEVWRGFPEPDLARTLDKVRIYIRAEYLIGAGGGSPICTVGVFNGLNTNPLSHGYELLGVNNTDLAVADYYWEFTAAEFAAAFPGGWDDVYLRAMQYHTLGQGPFDPAFRLRTYDVWRKCFYA